jgi:hypothetical protein
MNYDAFLLERQILALLCEQKQAVPPTLIPNILCERSCFYQPYADPQIEGHGPFDSVTKAYGYEHGVKNGSSIWLYENLLSNTAAI